MNKTVKHSASPLQFHLIGSNFTDIAPETWNYRNLKSRFWRLYLWNLWEKKTSSQIYPLH